MSVPGAFLDRDGVLIEDSGYPHLDEHLRLIPGAAAAVKRLNDLGYRTVIVTNQSGVARGLFDEDRMHAFNALLLERLADEGARIDAVYACPPSWSATSPATWRRRVGRACKGCGSKAATWICSFVSVSAAEIAFLRTMNYGGRKRRTPPP